MNRTFYNIPYSKLLNKLRSKLELLGKEMILQEESFTSKCDGLMLEEVCRHENYSGQRIERGLYLSGTGKRINADLNGAINIMRKYCQTKKIKFNKVNGENIFNPRKIGITCDVLSDQ